MGMSESHFAGIFKRGELNSANLLSTMGLLLCSVSMTFLSAFKLYYCSVKLSLMAKCTYVNKW